MFDDVSCEYLLPGELYQSSDPIMINTVLGSCISVTMFSRRLSFGMICHSMLPSSCDSIKQNENCMRYVDCALLYMNEVFTEKKIIKDEIEVKLFGGSDMFEYNRNVETIGAKNINAAVALLDNLKYTIAAKDIGGQFTRKLYFSTETGIVYVRKISRLQGI
ncbi:CheD, stimulates methylation of MCP protein [Denitrovibrio acetiphilus DSM 12809]|uniref:Probable chemoreceptor glutamine deamidase CheD n=1 Tax=Denitrovibrio acetiphilus (strain DSM 12809 / NBRC 114555 / N2460) TaxID=522772 RepID=D4H201_DENA2|nr:chemotaxis protein CheD [Denitrovibrio acetiphilus]ADD66978.1 CheD, stimulates methylation of MCP protein [Denitrovibrio acetiphilus DSM 12809]